MSPQPQSALARQFAQMPAGATMATEKHKVVPRETLALTRAMQRAEQAAHMLTLRESGLSNKEIAEALGCSHMTVYDRIGARNAAKVVA